jgi:hypothetical protein
MSNLFAVASKLFGIFLTWMGLQYVLSAWSFADDSTEPVFFMPLAGAVLFVFAFVLVFRTDGLARFVRLDATAPVPFTGFDSKLVLRTGIILIGLYVFITHIALALSMARREVERARMQGVGVTLAGVVIDLVPLALALLFIFGPDRVVRWVAPEAEAKA